MMTVSSQTRAIRNYRKRLTQQGVTRFEVLALDADRDLIRSLAKRLVKNDQEAIKIRSEVRRAISLEPAQRGGVLAALRRSPMVGADLNLTRSSETGRKVDL
jgi:hypothetical protein